MRRIDGRVAAVVGACLASGAMAGGLGDLVKGLGGAALVRATAPTIDRLLDDISARHGSRMATRVVPGYSVGRKTYVGAYQVTGESEQIRKVRMVFELTGQADGGRATFAHLIPSPTSNPLDMRRVPGVAVVAAVDYAVLGDVGTHPVGGDASSRLLRALEAVAAAKLVGPALNRFLNRMHGYPSTIESRVVPILTAGEKSYVGLCQVLGPGAGSTDVVLQVEEALSPKFRARILVPSDIGMELARVPRVGVGTVVSMTLRSGTRVAKEAAEGALERAKARLRAKLEGTPEPPAERSFEGAYHPGEYRYTNPRGECWPPGHCKELGPKPGRRRRRGFGRWW